MRKAPTGTEFGFEWTNGCKRFDLDYADDSIHL